MRCAIMQPTYLPWLGYFELMAASEVFIIFDDVQFEKKSWQQRNKIKTPNGELILVVPVKTSGAQFQKINEAEIDNSDNWKRKHLKSIEVSYRKSPFFQELFPKLQDLYTVNYQKLIDLDMALIKLIKKELDIRTKIVFSSEISAREQRDDKIIDICKSVGASELYDAAGAKEILSKEKFDKAKIKLVFQNYSHPVYSQLHGDFTAYMSVLDLMFNEGKKSLEIILSGAK